VALQSVFNAAAKLDTAALLPNDRLGQNVRFGISLRLDKIVFACREMVETEGAIVASHQLPAYHPCAPTPPLISRPSDVMIEQIKNCT
jgi:hypothetical protein